MSLDKNQLQCSSTRQLQAPQLQPRSTLKSYLALILQTLFANQHLLMAGIHSAASFPHLPVPLHRLTLGAASVRFRRSVANILRLVADAEHSPLSCPSDAATMCSISVSPSLSKCYRCTVHRPRCRAPLYSTWQAHTECVRRELQRQVPGHVPEPALVPRLGRSSPRDRVLAHPLQRGTTTQHTWLSVASQLCEGGGITQENSRYDWCRFWGKLSCSPLMAVYAREL